MTAPSTILATVRQQAAEVSANFWTDAEIYNHMSQAESIIVSNIGCSEAIDTSIDTTANVREYTLPSNVGTIVRLKWDNYRCNKIDINQLDDIEGQQYGDSSVVGQPESYYTFANKIGFTPVPDSSAEVSIYHYGVPTAVSSGSSAFTIIDNYVQYIPDYCLWMMFVKDQQLEAEAAFYQQKWLSSLALINHDHKQRKYRDRVALPVVSDYIMQE